MLVGTGLLKRIGERLDKKIDRLLLGRQKELDVEKEVQKLNLQIAEVMIQFVESLVEKKALWWWANTKGCRPLAIATQSALI